MRPRGLCASPVVVKSDNVVGFREPQGSDASQRPHEPERDQFMEDHNVIDMSARQLEQAIKDRDEARKAAETAQAEASAAEQARAKMAEDMALLNARLSGAQEDRAPHSRGPAGGPAGGAEERSRWRWPWRPWWTREAIRKAQAEAVARMQNKLDRAREAKRRAEDKQKIAEEALGSPGFSWREQARLEEGKGDLARGAHP